MPYTSSLLTGPMGNCTLFRLHFQQSTKLFSKIAKMNQSYWDMIGEISIFQPNWNMQKHSYAKSRKSIYFQTQTKIPFFHLRGFLIFNPTGLSFKQSFTIQTQALVEARVDGLRLFLSTKPSLKRIVSVRNIGEIILLNGPMVRTVLWFHAI